MSVAVLLACGPRRFRIALLVFAASVLIESATAASFEELASQATAARQQNKYPQAIELYRSALAVNPSWAEGWWFLGRLSYDTDQYPAAQDAFTHYVQLKDKEGAGWSFLGLCEFETGRYTDALDHLRRGFSTGIGAQTEVEDVLHFHMALLLTRLGLFDQASAEYTRFAKRGVKQPMLIAGIGLAALRRPLLPRDIPADQQQVVTGAGETAYLWMTGDTRKAESSLESLLNRFPNAPGVHYFYGSWLLASHPDQAIAQFERELTIDTHCADARAIIALALMRSVGDTAALPQAQRAAEDGPSTPMAQYAYGLTLAHVGDKRGIEHLETAEKLDPENFEYHMALASAYSKFGLYAEARRERAQSIWLAKESDPAKR